MPTEAQPPWEGGSHPDFMARMWQARLGDQLAWRSLVHEFSPRLTAAMRQYFWQLRTLRGRLSAEDLVQETWMTAATCLLRGELFHTPSQFLRWMIRVARFKAQRALRACTQIHKRSLGREVPLAAACWGREPSPAQVVQANDILTHWLRQLTMEQQHVLRLRKDGYTYEEIADTLHVSVRTVARRMEEIRDLILTIKALTPR